MTSPLSPEDLSWLIVDALVDAGIVSRDASSDAAEITRVEIQVRLAMGNIIEDPTCRSTDEHE